MKRRILSRLHWTICQFWQLVNSPAPSCSYFCCTTWAAFLVFLAVLCMSPSSVSVSIPDWAWFGSDQPDPWCTHVRERVRTVSLGVSLWRVILEQSSSFPAAWQLCRSANATHVEVFEPCCTNISISNMNRILLYATSKSIIMHCLSLNSIHNLSISSYVLQTNLKTHLFVKAYYHF